MAVKEPDGVVRPQGAVEKVSFEGDDLDVVRDERGVWVSIKRVCEVFGIDAKTQRDKLSGKAWAVEGLIPSTGADGKRYEMHCLHLDSLPMWLATIDEGRVAEHVRPKLAKYQRECATVLRDHFFGAAQAPDAKLMLSQRREERLALAERRRTADLMIRAVGSMRGLSERARDSLLLSAIDPLIPSGVAAFLPKVEQRWLTITETAEAFSVSAQRAGSARKLAGVVGNVPNVSEVRLSKSEHSTKQVEQTFVTPLGASMIGRQLVSTGHVARAAYAAACEEHDLPALELRQLELAPRSE